MNSLILPFSILILLIAGQAFWLGYRLSKPPKQLKRKRFFLIRGGKK